MAFIKTYPKTNKNISRIYFERNVINLEPDYQRNGDIWTTEKRQLLIDSIINNYDIPKLYFHELEMGVKRNKNFQYAVIDGRQRLETIWMFMENKFTLDIQFEYFRDPKIKLGGLSYAGLAQKYPDIKSIFDSFDLPIICVETDDLDLIDDMFLRLNEAVPLNAAEKRKGIRGPVNQSITEICMHGFFKHKVRFTDKRSQHREVACRLLFLLYKLKTEKKIFDTKKSFLDSFVREFKESGRSIKIYEAEVSLILDAMNRVFVNQDTLLRSQSLIPIYFLVFKDFITANRPQISRSILLKFREDIKINKTLAEEGDVFDYDLIEFDRMSLQGTNDATSIKNRTTIMKEYLMEKTASKTPAKKSPLKRKSSKF